MSTTTTSRIDALLKSKGLSARQMLLNLELSPTALSEWKRGKAKPTVDALTKIANYFDVSIDYLVGHDLPPASTGGVWIPVYGNVAAGVPIQAVEDILDYEEISADLASRGEYIALKLKGDSMAPRICDGDVVIVRVQPTVESGDIAIVLLNGEDATCKKVTFTDEGMMLIAFNAAIYPPRFYSHRQIEEMPIRILGKVIELRAKL